MNQQLQPFRLINERELIELHQRFIKALADWNEHQALFALSLHLNRTLPSLEYDSGYLFLSEIAEPIALLLTQDLSTLTHCLFGDTSDCFHPSSENQLTTLFNQLLGTQSLQRRKVEEKETRLREEWFYTGAPSLTVTLRGAHHSMTFCLHPQWVLQTLARPKEIPKPKSNLQDALASKVLHCQIELTPITLQLKDMLHLQVGDVIKTDHPLTSPLLINHEDQAICAVEIGTSNHYKSIQIASSL